jgi:hypothetical protein
MRFGEIERSTTNPIPSLLRSLPEYFACPAPKYESDVFLSQPALAPLQTGMFPGSSRNRCSIFQANRVGMNGEIKVVVANRNNKRDKKIYPGWTNREFQAARCRSKPPQQAKMFLLRHSFMPTEEVA